MDKGNPAYERGIFGTQFGDSQMKGSSSLGGIRPRIVRCVGVGPFKNVFVERTRDLGTV
jgi:hypothetical protein